MYMVDASDRDRFDLSRYELENLLDCEELASIPILVLANKIDKPGAATEEEIRAALGLPHSSPTYDRRRIRLFLCSVVKRVGYIDGFRWLSDQLQ